MKKFSTITVFVVSVLLASFVPAYSESNNSILFVYDTLDENSEFFITQIREVMRESGLAFDEMAVKDDASITIGHYDTVVVYSRVMAFNMSSPVRGWLKSVEDLDSTAVYIYVTANRWFEQKHKEQLVNIVSPKNPEKVDAVTSATEKMTEQEKVESIQDFVDMLKE